MEKKELPKYVKTPLWRFLDYSKDSMRLLHMSMQGISIFTTIPKAVRVLKDIDDPGYTPEEREKRTEEFHQDLANAEAKAEFAGKELKEGFPLLHAHTLVGLWSALE